MIKPITDEAYKLMHEGAKALSIVEGNGIRIDIDYIERIIEQMDISIKNIERKLKTQKIYKIWKKKYKNQFKFSSREQLGITLFDEIGYESQGYTDPDAKKLRHKTDEEALKSTGLKFVDVYLKMEQLKKARGTYLKAILRESDKGFLHPFFNLHLTQTYRSSSDHPNFQNIPVRDPKIAKLVRRCFIARKNHQIVEIDYGGAEICCATCYHKDPRMISYIKDKTKDLHRDMAAQCYILKRSEVDKQTRYCGKNMFVFPEFYGDYYLHCAKSLWKAISKLNLINSKTNEDLYTHLESQGIYKLGNSDGKDEPKKGTFQKHLKEVEEDFWSKRFKIYAKWKMDWWMDYREDLSFETLTGFLIKGVMTRKEVINYPVQGSAFHWLLWSLIQVQKQLKKYKMKSLIIGQIHDSIVGDVHKKELKNYLEICNETMTKSIHKHWPWIIVPLTVEAGVAPVGASWYDKKEYDL